MAVETAQERRARRVEQVYAQFPEIGAARPDKATSAALRELRLPQIIERLTEDYAERPALGQRRAEWAEDATGQRVRRWLPEFQTITYGELGARVDAVTAAWYESGVRAGDFVAIVGFTSIDYTILDLACVRLGAVAVPLQASAPVAQSAAILAETEPRVLAASADLVEYAAECMNAAGSPELFLLFDFSSEDEKLSISLAGHSRLDTLDALIDRGRGLPAAPVCAADDDTLTLLIYTSGSTGTPKGAMYTEPLVRKIWLAQPPVAAINLNFMPMSHVAGRMTLHGLLARGGTAYFAARSDMSTLFEDIALVRPTEMFFVPRVCDMVFQRFLSEVDRRWTPGSDRAAIEAAVKTELREQFLGGRVLTAICGSAPLAAEMRTFVESVIDLELHDGYGSTEAGGGLVIDNRVRRPPVLDYKLVDVPELGYFRTDRPHPRGELLLKTTAMIPGYFKRPDITAEVFDPDGFYRTGDIVAELGPDELVCVDRRNNVLKLSQGEFVTVAKLEAVFASSPLVRQIFVYGSSERAYLLAVVVPTEEALQQPDPKAAVLDSLQRLARDGELHSYEIPRDLLLETEPFSAANGFLSGIGKLLRPRLKEHYGPLLDQLYTDLAAAQTGELIALRQSSADRPVLETVGRAVRALLGCADTDLRPDAHFTDLGGDSLSALSLSNLLHDIFAVEVPVGVLTGPAADLRQIADYLVAERDSGRRPTFEAVHGTGTQVRAADLTLDRFLDAATLDGAARLPRVIGTRTVLLTGANGYLGRFLCLEWLQRLKTTGGTLICLVRGADTTAARQRLAAAFDSGDPALRREFDDLAADHLEVVAGDVGEPNFGLDEPGWTRLAETVDRVVHSAALVNHVLPYRQLFGPNVAGTAEVIRLALSARLKPVDFLSSVAVAAQIDPAVFDEDADIRRISPLRRLDDAYAGGYGTSKWAGEVLLREAHAHCGLPVAVFRSDMILAHSRYAGQLNLPDMFTRLLLSILATGIAPRSFYASDPGGGRRRAHYDGLPADFTAAAITALGGRRTGYQTYDVLNPHDDDISLDTFVDWLVEAGHDIQRVDDYADWLSRFENALRALPEEQRRQSLLPLLHAFARPARPLAGAALPAERFHAAVRATGSDIPHLEPALIAKYASDLHLRGLL
ncbi:carboxylic acid reductase [Nocardia sp. NPDC050435]|uniref:carboxylic acid reductase n=1 Tax=Nocardia sp. NPDC050435 TaxID=3155040 RepID=UPI0033F0CFDC